MTTIGEVTLAGVRCIFFCKLMMNPAYARDTQQLCATAHNRWRPVACDFRMCGQENGTAINLSTQAPPSGFAALLDSNTRAQEGKPAITAINFSPCFRRST